MGNIVAIEGLDGAGKHTFTELFKKFLVDRNYSAQILSFPDYKNSIIAKLAANLLHQSLPQLSNNSYLIPTLFALDRENSLTKIRDLNHQNDFLIIDRYLASNIAYTTANVKPSLVEELTYYLELLELNIFKLPLPTLQILLNVPPEKATVRTKNRSEVQARQIDTFEKNYQLQNNTWNNYIQLAANEWGSPWKIVDWEHNNLTTAEETIFPEILKKITDLD